MTVRCYSAGRRLRKPHPAESEGKDSCGNFRCALLTTFPLVGEWPRTNRHRRRRRGSARRAVNDLKTSPCTLHTTCLVAVTAVAEFECSRSTQECAVVRSKNRRAGFP